MLGQVEYTRENAPNTHDRSYLPPPLCARARVGMLVRMCARVCAGWDDEYRSICTHMCVCVCVYVGMHVRERERVCVCNLAVAELEDQSIG